MNTTVNYAAVQNPCKLCAPLGASLVFRGLEKTVGLLHGSQGCSTYIRRYLISHFREPVDIASSNFSEETAVFGGADNLKTALDNVTRQYQPELIGVASTCLSETIGDDVAKILKEYRESRAQELIPALVHVSTPSYKGSHMEGFQAAVLAVVRQLAERSASVRNRMALFPGLVSAEDLRYLKRAVKAFEIKTVVLPDYSETLDGPAWEDYHILPEGGTPVAAVRSLGACQASVEFGSLNDIASAGAFLEREFGVKPHPMDLPIGLLASDRFFKTLKEISGQPIPDTYLECRGRLLDAYADGHKHAFEVRVGIYGEEDWVVALADFTREIGMIPVLCASGSQSGRMRTRLLEKIPDTDRLGIKIMEAADFDAIERAAEAANCDLLIGNSKGYRLARRLKIPLIRVGFPIHDRLGGQRQLHLGYQGTLRLFDQIVNALIGVKQDQSDVGYAYM